MTQSFTFADSVFWIDLPPLAISQSDLPAHVTATPPLQALPVQLQNKVRDGSMPTVDSG